MKRWTEQHSCCVRKSERVREESCEKERRKDQQDEVLIFAEADAVICRTQHRRKMVAGNRLWRDCRISSWIIALAIRKGETRRRWFGKQNKKRKR